MVRQFVAHFLIEQATIAFCIVDLGRPSFMTSGQPELTVLSACFAWRSAQSFGLFFSRIDCDMPWTGLTRMPAIKSAEHSARANKGVVAVDIDIEKPRAIRDPVVGMMGWKAIHFRSNRHAVSAYGPQRIDGFFSAEARGDYARGGNFVEDVSRDPPLLRHLV